LFIEGLFERLLTLVNIDINKSQYGAQSMTNRHISRQLVEAGQALHGPQWKRPLARDLEVAESSVRDWASGRRAPPDDLAERLDRVLKRGKAAGTLQIPARAQKHARAIPAARAWCAPSSANAGTLRSRPAASTPARRDVAIYDPPATPAVASQSMLAIGGRPGPGLIPQGRGYAAPPDLAAMSPFTRAEEFRANTEIMLATLAAKADEQEKRIAALEAAAADRRARAIGVAQAFVGLAYTVFAGR
jgi:hypothetical protein